MPIHHSYDNEKIRLRRVHWIGSGWDRIRTQGKILEEFMGAIPIYPQEGKKKAERWNVIISTNQICLLLCPWEIGMPMQATPSPWCLVVALQLAEYTEGTRCDRAFSVVQGAGKGCTIRQDRLVGFKDHGFNQKCAITEAIENLPNGRHHRDRVMYYPNSPRKQVPLALSGVKSRKLSSLPTEDTAGNSSQQKSLQFSVVFITW